MRKKILFNTNAQISYTIAPVTKTRALSFERFLKTHMCEHRDTSNESFFLGNTSSVKSKLYDTVCYCFRSGEEAKKDAKSVRVIIDELHEAWLCEEDAAFFAMTDEEFDKRADRLAHKALNGIVDDEIIDADERAFRNTQLLLGKKAAIVKRAAYDLFFGARDY